MESHKVLIYGNGWISQEFQKYLQLLNINYHISLNRVDNHKVIKEELIEYDPSHVLCFIGRTHGIINGVEYPTIDYLEEEGKLKENIRDNLFSPTILAILCNKLNIHLTYLGTGCIFEGIDEPGFTEKDKANFFGSSYSVVKGFTDDLMRLFDNVLNLRIRMPIIDGKHPRDFIHKILHYEKVCSIPNSMSVLPSLIPNILDLIFNYVTGTFNITNPGVISHNEILEMYRDIVDPEFTWTNFTEEEQHEILKSKRSNNMLNTNKLLKFCPEVPDIKTAVKEVIVNMKENSSIP